MSLRVIEKVPAGAKMFSAQFRQVAREVAQRECSTREEKKKFLRHAFAWVNKNKYAFRSFRGTCRWSTYLTVVVHRLLVESRHAPSVRAQLGSHSSPPERPPQEPIDTPKGAPPVEVVPRRSQAPRRGDRSSAAGRARRAALRSSLLVLPAVLAALLLLALVFPRWARAAPAYPREALLLISLPIVSGETEFGCSVSWGRSLERVEPESKRSSE